MKLVGLRHLIADPTETRSIGTTLRKRRWDRFLARFPQLNEMRLLDLGGTVRHWQSCPVQPAEVVVANLLPEISNEGWIKTVRGDACDARSYSSMGPFDLVYSNSLIEHVGGHARRQDLAEIVYQLGKHHWIQTPYRYFPIEPHWLCPGLQFFSPSLRAAIVRRWPLSPAAVNREEALRDVLEVELLSIAQMKFHFPRSEILKERVMGLTKSLIAVG